MSIKYDKKTDTLFINLRSETRETFEYKTGDYSVHVDDEDTLVGLTIRKASRFLQQVISTGVQADKSIDKPKPVWEDVDSSMISAFKYDETTETLDVMFHRTGIYRYFDVPVDVVEGLRESSSKGSYMRSMIIDMYDYQQVKR
jgi:uncharacterized protein YuzE